jgi:hypothetical protein
MSIQQSRHGHRLMVQIVKAMPATALAIVCACLLACGGGGDGDTPVRSVLTDSQVLALLKGTQSPVPIWDVSQSAHGAADGVSDINRTYRWNIERDGFIPIKGLDVSPYVAQALDEIEQRLGRQIFDRTTLASVAEAAINRGLIIRNRTLPVIPGVANHCGMVHRVDGDMAPPGWVDTTQSMNPVVPADWQTAMQSTAFPARPQWYIDIDLSNPNCSPLQPLIVHELGHALGLSEHFDGFGLGNCSGALCQEPFYRVLKTLYANPPGTPFASLSIAR